VTLTSEQEEMAMAWARKAGTEYVEDPVFVRNFLADFSAALGITPPLKPEEVDFTPAIDRVAAERAARERLTPEERKALAAERKAAREALKAEYGHATVDGEFTDLGTYLAEPSCIFMGRGKHPLRGRWKIGPAQRDITLNLSPDAPRPAGEWAEIVWQPESMWIARWTDKLSGKVKYIWLADTSRVKQNKEAKKFDRATELDANLQAVRVHIEEALVAEEPRRRMVATAVYLIDALCLRVGDEKDPDEADTVGATTLRPEHVTLHEDGTAEFRFLGKDSVLWHKKLPLPERVRQNLVELGRNARPSRRGAAADKPQLFADISSRDVNAFLGELLPGLTPKVFRTHHATAAVQENLESADVSCEDPEYRKREAVMRANLEAALLCNHYKKPPASWTARRAKVQERRDQLNEQVQQAREAVREANEALAATRNEAREKEGAATAPTAKQRAKAAGAKKVEKARAKLEAARAKQRRTEETLARFNSQATMASKSRSWNLGTSLKSYIDPRVFYRWGQAVDYDVLRCYYPKTLQNKFAWVRSGEAEAEEGEPIAEANAE
jgi:DNA topoisomerase I